MPNGAGITINTCNHSCRVISTGWITFHCHKGKFNFKISTMAHSWFRYNGFGSPFDLLNYDPLGVKPACFEGTSICAIYAEIQLVGNNRIERPIITQKLVNAISFSIVNCIPAPDVRLKY